MIFEYNESHSKALYAFPYETTPVPTHQTEGSRYLKAEFGRHSPTSPQLTSNYSLLIDNRRHTASYPRIVPTANTSMFGPETQGPERGPMMTFESHLNAVGLQIGALLHNMCWYYIGIFVSGVE